MDGWSDYVISAEGGSYPFADSDKQNGVWGKASDFFVNFKEPMTAAEFGKRFGGTFTSDYRGAAKGVTMEIPYNGRMICFIMMDDSGTYNNQTILKPDMNVELMAKK